MSLRIPVIRILALDLLCLSMAVSLSLAGFSPAKAQDKVQDTGQDKVQAQGLAEGGFDPAQLEAMTASVRQVDLTEDMVTRLIASFPKIRETGAKFPGTEMPEQPPAPGSAASDLDAMSAEKRAALEAVAKHTDSRTSRIGPTPPAPWSAATSSSRKARRPAPRTRPCA
ncbi:hypothetical protein [Methyloceanibacter methanicus]|nr:hypothetical protein [Methyloceanibacter methanicus]